jgi:hypothetical protein
MPENPRPKSVRLDLANVQPQTEDYYEDADYTAPVKKNDPSMIEFLSARAKKPNA